MLLLFVMRLCSSTEFFNITNLNNLNINSFAKYTNDIGTV